MTASDGLSDLVDYALHPQPRIPLGFEGLDNEFRGVAPGETLLFIARTYVGKTNWLCNVICNRLDTPQVFFSLEMPARQVFQRLVAIHYNLPNWKIEDGIASGHPQVMAAIESAREQFGNVLLVDKGSVTLDEARFYIEQAEQHFGNKVRLVSFDYLERLGGDLDRSNLVASMRANLIDLKDLAKDLDLATVTLHQVSRGAGQNGGQPLELRDAEYAGEQQSDYVVGAYRPAFDTEMPYNERLVRRNEFNIQILKDRSGGGALTNEWHFEMDPQTAHLSLRREMHSGTQLQEDAAVGAETGQRLQGEGGGGTAVRLPESHPTLPY